MLFAFDLLAPGVSLFLGGCSPAQEDSSAPKTIKTMQLQAKRGASIHSIISIKGTLGDPGGGLRSIRLSRTFKHAMLPDWPESSSLPYSL